LDKKLHNLIEQQKLEAKYLLGASMGKFQGSLESAEQDIRNYINTKFGGREVLPAE
jgi:hypothetical protein